MPAMTDSDYLELMLANDQEPTLSDDVIAELLLRSRVRDTVGRFPDETDYVTTYDLHRAAARGWRLKAARVAAAIDLNVDGKGMSRSQMIAQFTQMADMYARLGGPRVRHIGGDEFRLRRYPPAELRGDW